MQQTLDDIEPTTTTRDDSDTGYVASIDSHTDIDGIARSNDAAGDDVRAVLEEYGRGIDHAELRERHPIRTRYDDIVVLADPGAVARDVLAAADNTLTESDDYKSQVTRAIIDIFAALDTAGDADGVTPHVVRRD